MSKNLLIILSVLLLLAIIVIWALLNAAQTGTDSGIKLDEEPITTLLRQKIKEKGLAQFYAEVEIIIRPVAPVGMVVNVEE